MPTYTAALGWFPGQISTLAAIDRPAQVVLVTHTVGARTMTGGDDWTSGCTGFEFNTGNHQKSSDYCAGRFKHGGGSVYLLADAHVKWFKGPDSWKAPNLTGAAWRRSLAPNAAAWFRED